MFTGKRLALWSGVAGTVLILGTITGMAWSNRGRKAPAHSAPSVVEVGEHDDTLTVRVVRPRRDVPEFVRTSSPPGYVKAYEKADLMSHVAGPVRWIGKNIGDPVTEGEILVELDVPDLWREVSEKDALMKQAAQEALLAEANVPIAEAAAREAFAQIAVKERNVDRFAAKEKYEATEYTRFEQMVKKGQTPAGILDELTLAQMTAHADWLAAQAEVNVAKANHEEFKAKAEAAKVDVKVKQARVAAAEAAKAHAQTLADYTTIRAPFNGLIVARNNVDRGTFVQSANTGKAVPMLTVVRSDIVTVVIWVSDKDAPYLSRDTEMVLRLDALEGHQIRAKVTRVSHALDPEKGRDMRVEVDLYNPTEPGAYGAMTANALGRFLAPLGSQRPETVATLLAAERQANGKPGIIKPGMYGPAALILQRFERAPLLPANAVFERGGRPCIFEVIDGHAKLVPVRVQLEDGAMVKVVKLVRRNNPKTGRVEEVAEELTGDEDVIRGGQGDVADGQAVNVAREKW